MPKNRSSRPLFRGIAGACLLPLIAMLWFVAPVARAYPPAGWHKFDSVALLRVSVPAFGLENVPLTAVGPTHIRLGDPYDPGDGRIKINTEIETMVLSGPTPLGPAVLRVLAPAPGCIQQKEPGVDFPANSWFDIRVEIVVATPNGPITVFSDPNTPVRMMAMINSLPPLDSTYAPEGTFVGVDLVDSAGNVVGTLAHAGHTVGQQPSFSVAPDGPSGLDPADLFKRKTSPVIRAGGLSLGSGDDVDALSYGLDFIFTPFLDPLTGDVVPGLMDVRFSVDEGAQGRAGSHVRREALKSEATGDEFQVGPVYAGFGGGANIQILDENGDTAPDFPLQLADNVDALAEQPPDFADPDNDGTPNRDIYFSLAPGSPALGANSPADILVSSMGGPPTVFISAEELGLDPVADDIDALCVNTGFRAAVFSLAGSSDLSIFFLGQAFPWTSAANLGLEPSDDVNALKCHAGENAALWNGIVSASLYDGNGFLRELVWRIESEMTLGRGVDGEAAGLLGNFKSKSDDDFQVTANLAAGLPVVLFQPDLERQTLTIAFEVQTPDGEYVSQRFTVGGTTAALAWNVAMSRFFTGSPQQSIDRIPLFHPDGSPSPFSLGDLTVTLDGRPKSAFTAEGFLDAAGFGEQPSPGGLATLFGEFPTNRAAASAIPLPRRDGDEVEVLFETNQSLAFVGKEGAAKTQGAPTMIPAPLLFVDPTQINVQIPWEVDASGGTVTAIVRANGVAGDPVELQIAPTSPGVFTTQFGAGPAIAINGDGTLAQPTGSLGASHPAAVGETIVLLVSGLGETVPPGVTGADSFDANGAFVRRDTAQPVRVVIGGVEATVVFAGLSPQFVGVFQINVTVPAGVTPGDVVSLLVEVGGRQSRSDVTVAIAPAP